MRNTHRRHCARLAVVVGAGLLFAATQTGCNKPSPEPPPKVFPVKGVVKQKSGQPFDRAMIEFRLEDNPTFMMSSAIEPDGKFELHTLFGNQKLPGGAAGACRVTVYVISTTG